MAERPIAPTLATGEIAGDLNNAQDDVEVPDDVEHILEELFEALQDKVCSSFLLEQDLFCSPHIVRTQSCAGRQLKVLQGLPNAFPKTLLVRF